MGSLNHSQLLVVRLSFQQSNTCNLEIRYHTTGDSLSTKFICPEFQTDGTVARDMVVRYDTELEDSGVFLTDSNSFYSVERKRNHSSNLPEHHYYPVTAFGLLEDKTSRFTVLTDRASGATSDSRGVLEIMYNRIGLLEDTDLGTEEGNILSPAATITHRLVFEATSPIPGEGPVFRAAQIMAESQPTFLQLISKTVGLKLSLRTHTSDLVIPAKPQTLTKHCKIGLETSDGVKVFMRVIEYSAACTTATRPVTDFIEALGVSTTKACVEAASLDLLGKPMKEEAGITTQLLFPRLRAFHVLPCS